MVTVACMQASRPSESKYHDDPSAVLFPVGERGCQVYIQVAANEARVSTRGSCADTECGVKNYMLSNSREHDLGAEAPAIEYVDEADISRIEEFCARLCYLDTVEPSSIDTTPKVES